jgi:Flp pilus assembly secretin CpaC
MLPHRTLRRLGWRLLSLLMAPTMLAAQTLLVAEAAAPERLQLVAGRSMPVVSRTPVTKVTVANPDVADVVVIGESDVVINGIAAGETDIILWGTPGTPHRHFRVAVRASAERRQILLAVKFAEVRKEALRQLGTSLLYRDVGGSTRAGTGTFRNDRASDEQGRLQLPPELRYLTVLSTFNTRDLLALLDAEEQRGNARYLAEPNLMAANLEEASFLAGGEVPIPIVQGSAAGNTGAVTIQFREFGIRLGFRGEVLSDSLVKLRVKPEVSSLDFTNAVTLQGFRIPALRTRRVESTVDVLDGRSLIISGLFNEEREQVRAGIPYLSSVPILGALFSSTRWLRSESELVVIVSPVLTDPNQPRAADLVPLESAPDLPARPALGKRLPPDSTAR